MAEQKWPKKCLDCGADVEYDGDDLANNGFGPCKKHPGNHRVEGLIYYHSGARSVQDIRERRNFSPQIWLIPSYPKTDPKTGNTIQTRGLMVTFGAGKLETDDPEKQFFLDQRSGEIVPGEEGERMWRDIYLDPQQQADFLRREGAELADRNRKLREENTVLESVKARTKEGRPASA